MKKYTKNEALKLAIDGKKIKQSHWSPSEHIYWDGFQYIYIQEELTPCVAKVLLDYDKGWTIYNEYVDFATAWKAYEEGKRIQSEYWDEKEMKLPYTKKEHEGHCNVSFYAKAIRGKWLILEDE